MLRATQPLARRHDGRRQRRGAPGKHREGIDFFTAFDLTQEHAARALEVARSVLEHLSLVSHRSINHMMADWVDYAITALNAQDASLDEVLELCASCGKNPEVQLMLAEELERNDEEEEATSVARATRDMASGNLRTKIDRWLLAHLDETDHTERIECLKELVELTPVTKDICTWWNQLKSEATSDERNDLRDSPHSPLCQSSRRRLDPLPRRAEV